MHALTAEERRAALVCAVRAGSNGRTDPRQNRRLQAQGDVDGGLVPLGYDVGDRHLVVNEAEAATVREIFRCYQELGSVRLLKAELDRRGLRSKIRVAPRSANQRELTITLAQFRRVAHSIIRRRYTTGYGKKSAVESDACGIIPVSERPLGGEGLCGGAGGIRTASMYLTQITPILYDSTHGNKSPRLLSGASTASHGLVCKSGYRASWRKTDSGMFWY